MKTSAVRFTPLRTGQTAFKKILHFRLLVILLLLLIALTLLSGSAAAASVWKYTSLGDSLANGYFAWEGYVFRYEDYIEIDAAVTVDLTNYAVPGSTSTDLLNELRTNSSVRNSLANSRVVTWDIGSNDFRKARDQYKQRICGGADNQDCLRNTLASFKANWKAIIAQLLSLRSPKNTILRTMNYYNPYVNADKASDTWPNDAGNDFQVFKPYFDDVNSFVLTSSICATTVSPYTRCADVYHKFNGPNGDIDPRTFGYISWDGLHPNDTGHKAIADLLRALRYAPLR